tara:strand:- start:400 stop:603 length:204 start_codon:yes stop_codon:yes gene_type:complete
MKITFTSQRITDTVTYQAGDTYDLPTDEANKWKRNGVANDAIVVEVKDIEKPKNKSVKKKTTRRKVK